jgi:predicted nucleotidyltransferase
MYYIYSIWVGGITVQTNKDYIIAVTKRILDTIGGDCDKIILFGSRAYGTPREDSDYDFFVVLDDNAKKPVTILQSIYRNLAKSPNYLPVDLLASYKTGFDEKSKLPAIEQIIAQKGVVLYERP